MPAPKAPHALPPTASAPPHPKRMLRTGNRFRPAQNISPITPIAKNIPAPRVPGIWRLPPKDRRPNAMNAWIAGDGDRFPAIYGSVGAGETEAVWK